MNTDPALALAFLNTATAPGGGPGPWMAPEDLRAWLAGAGLVEDAGALQRLTPPDLRLLMDDALVLRRAVAELVDAWTTPGASPASLAVLELNRILAAGPRHTLALATGPGGYAVHSHVSDATVRGLLAPIAEAAVLLLSKEDPTRVRRCAAPACARWFLDTSKNQRRRWCSMSVCGNRAKVAAHLRRKKDPGD